MILSEYLVYFIGKVGTFFQQGQITQIKFDSKLKTKWHIPLKRWYRR